MTNIKDAGNVGSNGSTRQPLPRLNPCEIATLLLPGTNVQVMDATDAQFEAMLAGHDLHVESGIVEWSFDDRIRFINYMRKCGLDLFASPNKNNSAAEQKQLSNNSPERIDSELFKADEAAVQALSTVPDVDLLIGVGNVCNSVLKKSKKSSKDE